MSRQKKRLDKTPRLATITRMSHDGRGIAHIDGKTNFIFGALPGEVVEFIPTEKHASFNAGIVSNVISPALNRIPAKCAAFTRCGGCRLQHLATPDQIEFKQNILLEQLQHIGGITPEQILPAITAATWQYRHKARLGVKYVKIKHKILIGFREIAGRYIAETERCEILPENIGGKLSDLSDLIAKLSIYDQIPQIEVAIGTAEIALIFRHLAALTETDLKYIEDFAKQNHFKIYLQPKGIESISLFYPKSSEFQLSYEIPRENLKLKFNPSDFTQINPDINQKMIQQALALLDLQPNDQVLDLFCGLGNFSLAIAKHAKQVFAVEGDAGLIERAKLNAKLNHLSNLNFYVADLTKNNDQAPWQQQKYDKILLDPPRSGALDMVKQLKAFAAKKIVYVSCNPATLARDSKVLSEIGYHLKCAGVMDMFPHTAHVESIALFEKNHA